MRIEVKRRKGGTTVRFIADTNMCNCHWPGNCDGTGFLFCTGCMDEGEVCYCACGGQRACPGCWACLGPGDGQ